MVGKGRKRSDMIGHDQMRFVLALDFEKKGLHINSFVKLCSSAQSKQENVMMIGRDHKKNYFKFSIALRWREIMSVDLHRGKDLCKGKILRNLSFA